MNQDPDMIRSSVLDKITDGAVRLANAAMTGDRDKGKVYTLFIAEQLERLGEWHSAQQFRKVAAEVRQEVIHAHRRVGADIGDGLTTDVITHDQALVLESQLEVATRSWQLGVAENAKLLMQLGDALSQCEALASKVRVLEERDTNNQGVPSGDGPFGSPSAPLPDCCPYHTSGGSREYRCGKHTLNEERHSQDGSIPDPPLYD